MKIFKIAIILLALGEIAFSTKVCAERVLNIKPIVLNKSTQIKASSKTEGSKPLLALAALNRTSIPFNICSTSPTWVRPDKATQIWKLQNLKRYGDVTENPMHDVIESWWTHDVFSFTTYGASLFYDYTYLSGLWTSHSSTTWRCSSNYPMTINSRQMARVWLLLHKIVNIKWVDNHYVMVVKPTDQGVQVIQFSRREHQDLLPLKVVAENGRQLEVLSN